MSATCGHPEPGRPRMHSAPGSAASGAQCSRARRPVRVTQHRWASWTRSAERGSVTLQWSDHPVLAGRWPRAPPRVVAVSVVERCVARGAQPVTHQRLVRALAERQGSGASGAEGGTRPGERCPGWCPMEWPWTRSEMGVTSTSTSTGESQTAREGWMTSASGIPDVAASVGGVRHAWGAHQVTQERRAPPRLRWRGSGRSGPRPDPRHGRESACPRTEEPQTKP